MARTSVQSGYYDASAPRFPGQICDHGTSISYSTRGYPAEGELRVGRGCVKGTVLAAGGEMNAPAPHSIKTPVAGSVLADFIGVVVRTEACSNDADGNAIYKTETMATSTFGIGSGKIIAVKTNAAVTHGQAVYMSVNAAIAPNLPAGEFHNAAGSAGATIAITGATWFGSHASGAIGMIQL